MIDKKTSPYRLHALKCDGCFGKKSRSIIQDRVRISICEFCQATRNASALRRQIKISKETKKHIENNTFFANADVIVSNLKLENLLRSNAIALIKIITLGMKTTYLFCCEFFLSFSFRDYIYIYIYIFLTQPLSFSFRR
jgi:hypothetical protein